MSTPKKPNDGEKKPSWLESLFGSSKQRKAVTERVRTASIFHALTPRFLQKKNNDSKPSTPALTPAKTPEQEKKDKKHFLATLFTPRAHKNSLSASNPNLSKLLKKDDSKGDQIATTPTSPASTTTTTTTSHNNSPSLLITIPSPSTVSSPVLIPMDTPKKQNDHTVRKSRSFHQGGFNSLPTTPQFSFRPTQQSSLEESEIKLLAAKAKNRLSTSPNTVAQLQMQAILVDRFAKRDHTGETMLMVIADADEQSSNSTGTNSNPSSLTHSVANDHLTSYAAGSILKDALVSQELATTTTTTISPDAEEDDDDLEEDKAVVVVEDNDTEEDLYAKAQLFVDEDDVKSVPQQTFTEDNSNEPLYVRIHRACGEGNYKLLSKLIQTDDKVEDNINMIDPSDQSTPLHKAASRNRHEVMKLLLTKGAGINAKDQFASTPLHWACANANIECIHVLCNYGAEINVRDRYGYAPIHLALKKKCFRGAEILVLYGGDINLKKSDGTTVLHQACESGDMDLVKWLLGKEKVLINCKDKRGETPLLRAATHGRIKVVEHLLNTANVQINLADDKKQTMLHRSAMYGFRDLLLMVAFHDPNICNAMLNEQDIEGRTPLHYAVIKNHFREVKTLTTMGADLNFQDRHGNTPLMIALKNNMPKIARFLYKVGANSDVKNKKNESAKSMLKSNNLLK